MMESVRFCAALLAGGQSRRMGMDKRFLIWQGQALWRHQWDKLSAVGAERVVLCAGVPPWPADMAGYSPLEDPVPDAGPLGGLVAAMASCHAPLVLVLGVDLPAFPLAGLEMLLAASRGGKGAVFLSPADGHFSEPLAALYPLELLPALRSALAAGRFALQPLVRKAIADGLMVALSPPPNEWLINLNTPGDLARCGLLRPENGG